MSVPETLSERRPFRGQDPWVVAHHGSLLLVQSASGNRRIVVKRFRDLEQMERHVETVVWPPQGSSHNLREVCAPELQLIDERSYIYFAASEGGRTGTHRTYALVADDPLGPYSALGPVCDPTHDVWAVDLTVLRHEGQLFAVWSGWEGPHDPFPQNLYLAPMANPWTVSGERSCISRPQYDWEMSLAPVNETPEVIRDPNSGRLFILYSADASWTNAYKMGLLEWIGGDLTQPASWRKLPRPFFTGGGLGCVLDSAAGDLLVYHGRRSGNPGSDRQIRWVPLAWDAGYPLTRSSNPPT